MLSSVQCPRVATSTAAQRSVVLAPPLGDARRSAGKRAQVVRPRPGVGARALPSGAQLPGGSREPLSRIRSSYNFAMGTRGYAAASAISKQKKADIVANLTELLNKSTLVYGMEYKGISVPALESMRTSLPADSHMVVTKNRLLRVAVENMESEEDKARWEGLCGQKGQNAYVFSTEEGIRESVKAYNDLLKALKDDQPDAKKGQPAPPPPTQIKCIVMDGQAIDAAKWKTLEKIPTKQELLTKIAVGIKANPRKIAVGIKALPTKLAYGVKALSELNDDKEMTVEAAAKLKAESGDE